MPVPTNWVPLPKTTVPPLTCRRLPFGVARVPLVVVKVRPAFWIPSVKFSAVIVPWLSILAVMVLAPPPPVPCKAVMAPLLVSVPLVTLSVALALVPSCVNSIVPALVNPLATVSAALPTPPILSVGVLPAPPRERFSMLTIPLSATVYEPARSIATLSVVIGTAPSLQFAGSVQLPPLALVQWITLDGATETSNAELVADVTPVPVATSVYPIPSVSMLRSAKVATPATAATGNVPVSVPPAGLLPIAMVTLSVALVARVPPASSSETSTAGEIATVAATALGSTEKASCVAT